MERIMHLLSSNSFSGAENVVISNIKHIMDENEHIYVSPSGTIKKKLQDEGIEYRELEKIGYKYIKKIIDEENITIIHAHDFKASIVASIFSKRCMIVSHIHQNPIWLEKINLKSVVYALSTIRIKYILTVSESVMDNFVFKKFIQRKLRIVNNVVDIEEIIEKSKDINEDYYDLIFVGRLEPVKNPEKFIDIFEHLHRLNYVTKAVMIGDGSLRSVCEKRIDELKLDIDMVGFKDNPYPYIKNSKIMILPSQWEGFGLVAAESLILGTPVICSRVGGLVDIVSEECGGFAESNEEYASLFKKICKTNMYYYFKENAIDKGKMFGRNEQWYSLMNSIYMNGKDE